MSRPEVDVAAAFPHDGPYSPDTVRDAAAAIDDLMRYLANATGKRSALTEGADAAAVLGQLDAAVWKLPQILQQLGAFAGQIADDPLLYDDRHDRPGDHTARELESRCQDAAVLTRRLSTVLSEAHSLAAHLGHDQS